MSADTTCEKCGRPKSVTKSFVGKAVKKVINPCRRCT